MTISNKKVIGVLSTCDNGKDCIKVVFCLFIEMLSSGSLLPKMNINGVDFDLRELTILGAIKKITKIGISHIMAVFSSTSKKDKLMLKMLMKKCDYVTNASMRCAPTEQNSTVERLMLIIAIMKKYESFFNEVQGKLFELCFI